MRFGNQTKIIYNENAVNAIGQKVLQVTTIDPKNQSVVKIEDAYGKIVQEDVMGLENQLITSKKMSYDPNGNLLLQKNLIFQNGQYQRTLETQYRYDSNNQVISTTRAANSPNSRTTSYRYTSKGKIATKIKPDGTILSYAMSKIILTVTLTLMAYLLFCLFFFQLYSRYPLLALFPGFQ